MCLAKSRTALYVSSQQQWQHWRCCCWFIFFWGKGWQWWCSSKCNAFLDARSWSIKKSSSTFWSSSIFMATSTGNVITTQEQGYPNNCVGNPKKQQMHTGISSTLALDENINPCSQHMVCEQLLLLLQWMNRWRMHTHHYHHKCIPRFGTVGWNPKWCKSVQMMPLRCGWGWGCITFQTASHIHIIPYMRCLSTYFCGLIWAHGCTLTPLPVTITNISLDYQGWLKS